MKKSSHRSPEGSVTFDKKTDEIVVVFDRNLNYLETNEAACAHLKMTPAELIGKNVLDLFPDLIASKNHRNLLRALGGEILRNMIVESRMGQRFKITYTPLVKEGLVSAILVNARKMRSKPGAGR